MKKKMFLASLCLFTLGVINSVAQTAVAALHHNGNVTLYSGGQLQKALDAAEQGDTIYLSEGSFIGDVKVEKSNIALIGTGVKTILSGYFYLGLSDATIENNYIEGLNILGNRFYIEGGLQNAKISQCQFNEFLTNYTDGLLCDLTIYMCFCKSLLSITTDSELTIVNSKIKKIECGHKSAHFVHCNIGEYPFQYSDNYSDNEKTVLTNCIINVWGTKATCINSYICSASPAGIIQNCYTSAEKALDDNLDCILTNLGDYLGNDGTVVGITGGDTPYTLTPSAPHVASHKIEVDKVNQKLNVTLTIEN